MPLPNPVIVIPGITASDLRDEYPTETERIWSLMSKQYERVYLHPDNARYEARQPSVVRPDRVWGVIYSELVEELRHELTVDADRPVPVYPFAYDWRQPLHVTVRWPRKTGPGRSLTINPKTNPSHVQEKPTQVQS